MPGCINDQSQVIYLIELAPEKNFRGLAAGRCVVAYTERMSVSAAGAGLAIGQ